MAAVENQLAFGREFNDSGRFVNDQRTLLTFGTTPGGTFYATTPRGTRITYDRDFLITCQNSPLAKSAPKNLPVIPGVTVASEIRTDKNTSNKAACPKAGNRIKYDRDFLLSCQKSPLATVKPQNLPNIPGLMRTNAATKDSNGSKTARADSTEDSQFDMEM